MPAFYDGFEVDQHFYLAQEFIEGKSLEEVIATTRLTDEWMLRWAASLCYALSYLHGLQIVHHDLKPANIRIRPNGRLALLDFGAARYFGQNDGLVPESFTEDDELYGTEGYLPPEMEGDGNFTADVRTDIFALGCILYEMVMGEPPQQKMINERMSFITTPLMSRKDVNLDYVKLVTTALSYNTDYRYGSVQVFLDALKPITPPFMMISTKQLTFGKVEAAKGVAKRKFTIFNGGGKSEISGDVKSKSPWLTIEMAQFRGQKRDMVVVADPLKVQERDKIARGAIEVWSAEKRDKDNKLISASERLYIECTIVVSPMPAKLVLLPASEEEPGYIMRVRKGAGSSVTLHVSNAGEKMVDVKTVLPEDSGLSAEPTSISLAGRSKASIQLTLSRLANPKIDSSIPIKLVPSKGQTIDVNIQMRAAPTLVDGLMGLFKR
jgi:serine/threonine protein kinase